MDVNEYKIEPHIMYVCVYLCWGMGSGMCVILNLGSYASARGQGGEGSAQYLSCFWEYTLLDNDLQCCVWNLLELLFQFGFYSS